MASPIVTASPVITLRTSAGTPACTAKSTKPNAVKGVSGAGLTIQGQPAANAGATLRVIIAAGKFQGVMAATTPIGCLFTTIRASG